MKIIDISDSVIGLFFVMLSFLVTSIFIINNKGIDKWVKIVVLTGFIVRLVLVFVDVFVTRLPDAGMDDDGFYDSALGIYNDGYSTFFDNEYGGMFSRLLSITFYFIGPSRLGVQYLNALMYVIIILILSKAMVNLGVSKHMRKIGILIITFMPYSILYNSILRRETIIELCVCLSVYYFSKWYNGNKLLYASASVVFILLASLFHTAFVLGTPIFVIYFALYNKKKRSISFSVDGMSKAVLLLFCVIAFGFGFLSMWSNKFTSVSDVNDIYTVANRARGGSVYLEGYEINSIGQLVLFTPLKLFYFLFSPTPWMFRNIMDIISFALDAMIYFVLLFKVIKMRKDSTSRLMLTVFLVLSIVFALGTFNSGTAIRHRFSLLPFLLISYSLSDASRLVSAKTTGEKITRTKVRKVV